MPLKIRAGIWKVTDLPYPVGNKAIQSVAFITVLIILFWIGFTLAKHLGIGLNGNYIIVNEDKMTNIEGLFAGGDCIGGLLQVSKAVSDGAIAATSIAKFLRRS